MGDEFQLFWEVLRGRGSRDHLSSMIMSTSAQQRTHDPVRAETSPTRNGKVRDPPLWVLFLRVPRRRKRQEAVGREKTELWCCLCSVGIDWSPFKEVCEGIQHPHSFRSQGEALGRSRGVQLYLLCQDVIPPQLPTARLPSCPTVQIASMTWVKGTFLASEDWSLQFPLMMTQSSHPPTASSSLSCLLSPSIVVYGRRPE